MTFPEYIREKYKIIQDFSHIWKGGMVYTNKEGVYLMDSDKNHILY